MRQVFIFIALLFMIVLAGCEKPLPNRPVTYLPQVIKDWMYFKEGTLWKYENQATGVRDVVKVDTSYLFIHTESDITLGDTKEEKFEYTAHSELTKEKFTYTSLDRCVLTSRDSTIMCYEINRTTLSKAGSLSFSHFFFQPVAERPATLSVLESLYDTFTVAGREYTDVAQITELYTPHTKITYYIVKHFGIIRKDVIPDEGSIEQWNLIDCHIVQ